VTYTVILLSRARRQLFQAAEWWAKNRSAEQADRWLTGFRGAIASLSENPEIHGLAHETDQFPFELRQLPFGLGRKPTHRALFEIRGNEVIVYTVRHVAQRDVTPDDF
jgi:plasmid stabilization system protein ParE